VSEEERRLIHGQVCYLQLPATDRTRAAKFYQAVFGWDIEQHHPDFTAPGLIGQWITDRPPAGDAGPVIWIQVTDMKAALDRAGEHGAQVLEPPSADGPARVLATILDSEGNRIGLAAHLTQVAEPEGPLRDAADGTLLRPRTCPAGAAGRSRARIIPHRVSQAPGAAWHKARRPSAGAPGGPELAAAPPAPGRVRPPRARRPGFSFRRNGSGELPFPFPGCTVML
jgi:predicted enzyme related to lactoylglutathione lyase